MSNAVVRWAVPLGSLMVVGPIAAWLTSMLRAVDGTSATPALLSSSPIIGLVLVLMAVGLAGLAGVVASRLMGAGWGLFCSGMVLAWATWPTGTVDMLLRRTQSSGSLWTLAVEGLLVGAAVTAASWVVIRAHAEGMQLVVWKAVPVGVRETGGGTGARRGRRDDPGMDVFVTGLVAVIVGAGVGGWLAGQEALKGQAIGAAFVGGLLGAVAARLSAERCPSWVLVAGLGVLAGLSPVLAALIHGSGAVQASYDGSLFNLAKLMPLDWMAGGLMGLPIGLSWAGGMIEEGPRQGSPRNAALGAAAVAAVGLGAS